MCFRTENSRTFGGRQAGLCCFLNDASGFKSSSQQRGFLTSNVCSSFLLKPALMEAAQASERFISCLSSSSPPVSVCRVEGEAWNYQQPPSLCSPSIIRLCHSSPLPSHVQGQRLHTLSSGRFEGHWFLILRLTKGTLCVTCSLQLRGVVGPFLSILLHEVSH